MRIFSKYALSAPVSAMPHRAAIFAMQKCDKIKTACDCSSPQNTSPDGIFRRDLCFIHLYITYLFISSRTALKQSTTYFSCSFVWEAQTCVRILALPFGTTGYEKATT